MDPLIIIASLERKLNELAHGSLQRPSDTTAYGYGLSVGTYQGLLQAIQEIRRLMLDEDDED